MAHLAIVAGPEEGSSAVHPEPGASGAGRSCFGPLTRVPLSQSRGFARWPEKKRRVRKCKKVPERPGRPRERRSIISQLHGITITKAPDGMAGAAAWTPGAAFDARSARAGFHVLRTCRTVWDPDRTVWTSRWLTEPEAALTPTGSESGLRHARHRLGERIDGHPSIALLALYGLNVIRTRPAARLSWP